MDTLRGSLLAIVGVIFFLIVVSQLYSKDTHANKIVMAFPQWARWVPYLIAFSATLGLFEAWEEKRFVAAFAESTVAWFLHFVMLGLAVFSGFWFGQKISYRFTYTRFRLLGNVLGFVVGVSLFFSVFHGLKLIFHEIPGVGWRIERQLSSD